MAKSPKIKEFVSDLLNSQNFKNRNIFNYNNIKKSYDNFIKLELIILFIFAMD